MTKNLFIIIIFTIILSCTKKEKVIFSTDNLIGEYSSTENGDIEFVIKKDKSGYYLQQRIKNGTTWSPRENLKEMTAPELTLALGPNWKKFTYAGLTSEICSYFKVSAKQNGITAGEQPNTEYFSRCFSDNYFYKIKNTSKDTSKFKDTLESANDTLLLKKFMKTLFDSNNLTIENKTNQIENILKYVDNPNFMINGFTFLNEIILNESSIKDKATKLRIIDMLISKGADVNMLSGTYSTPPLFQAKDAEIAKILLENGANPNYISGTRYTMFSNYITYDRLKIAKEHGFNFKFVNDKGETLLHIATNNTQYCWVNDLDFLIKQIPEYINKYDENGYAPIHYYARENFIDFYPLIEVLIKNGANPKIKTKKDSYYNEILIPKGSTPYKIINIIQNTYSNPSKKSLAEERNKILELLK